MDEPTAALGVRETGQVLDLIKRIRDRGIAGDLDQPRHAARLRGRRPDPHQRLGRRAAVVTPRTHTMSEAVAIMTGATPGLLDKALTKEGSVE